MENLKKIKIHKRENGNMPMMDEPSLPYSLPTIHVQEKQISEVADWEVGKTYRLIVEVKMTSKSEREKNVDASLEISAYKNVTEKDVADMDEKEFEEYEAKQRSGGKKY